MRAAALLGIVLLAMAARGQEPKLLGHWPLDTGEGQTIRDASGNGHEGTMHGAAWVPGKTGNALQFDGQDDYVLLGDLGTHAQVTVAFWVKGEELEKRPGWQGTVTSGAWEQGVLHLPIGKGRIEAYLHLGEKRRGRLTGPPLRNNRWYHVAVVLDAERGSMRLFVDGAEVDAADFAPLEAGIKLAAQAVGREFDGKGFSRYLKGTLDDIRIYSAALDAAQIRALCPDAVTFSAADPRNVVNGRRIPDEGYCDQPYVVVTPEGHWVCTLTTGPGREGHHGQHVVSTISTDRGRTWSPLVDIESSDGPEASWVVPLIVPSGRIYAFYTYNGENVRTLRGKPVRVDTVGWYAYKYSDDGGRSWSEERHRLPLRLTACDRGNDWNGEVQIFWGIDKPKVVDGAVMWAFTKLGKYMLEQGEGWFWRSENILTEPDVAKLRWELLPPGEHGLRAEKFGSVQEEHNIVPLSDGSLYCVYRTSKGHPCHAYSRDGGRTWTTPEVMTYTPDGRPMKTPRACPRVWRMKNGRFLFWLHNRKGTSYRGRNPVWVAGGVESDGFIHWSQPEILLYHPGDLNGMSYPDLIEQDGRVWVTETQKTIARVHEVDRSLLEGLWTQGKEKAVSREGLAADRTGEQLDDEAPRLAEPLDLRKTGGLSIGLWLLTGEAANDLVLCDGRDEKGRGLLLSLKRDGALHLTVSDGIAKAAWESGPGALSRDGLHHLMVIVDAGPRVISCVMDGVLWDGGPKADKGWARYDAPLGDVSGAGRLTIPAAARGSTQRLRVYRRGLRTSEAIANFHAGP